MDTPNVQAIAGFTSALEWCSFRRTRHKPTVVSRVLSNDAAGWWIRLWASYFLWQVPQFSPNRCWLVSLDMFLVI